MIPVEIDRKSGFCGGVIRAISRAEETLAKGGRLYSLGAIVHNERELSRLRDKGLGVIEQDRLAEMEPADGAGLLIRAHGVPPQVYDIARSKGFSTVDCTCPVVLQLQKNIREAYLRVKSLPRPGQLLIFGKVGHPEVLGLVGQVNGDAVVFESLDQLETLLGDIDFSSDMELFSQTTMSPDGYAAVCSYLRERMAPGAVLNVHDTICSQVASRHSELSDFAARHDVIIFVSGHTSSNGKVLFELCRSVNPRTYRVGSEADLDASWFGPGDSVGVSGATSTPKWLLEKVAETVKNLH